ncbi:MAG: pyridoxine 5'-phosphate synthase [Flavobacteriales bacterium AspAUS03]
MTRLSVNINKIATLRNARGGNIPDVVQAAIDIQRFGAQGITVHPRPDERHIRYQDVYDLKPIIMTEFNIEGNPTDRFIQLILKVKPDQVTLVPDAENVLTSNAGWDTITHQTFLTEVIDEFKRHNIRTSIFLDPDPKYISAAAKTGTDRIELYTESFALAYARKDLNSIQSYVQTAQEAVRAGLALNAGHDLNLKNIAFLIENIPAIAEVSIGHTLIAEAIYFGLENTIQAYLKRIEKIHRNKQQK